MSRKADDDPVVVEIVDVRDPVGAGRARSRAGRGWDDAAADEVTGRSSLTWVGVGVLFALAVAVAVVNLADARRETERLSALGDTPGVLRTLDHPLVEVWRADGGQVFAASAEVVVLRDITGQESLSAIDTVTGELRWTRTLTRGEACVPVGSDGSDGAGPTPALVACSRLADPDEVAAGVVTGAARLVALDIGTGAELRSLSLETEPMTLDVVDDDLVVSRVGDRATVQVLRWDPGADRVVWAYRSDPGRADTITSGGWWMSHLEGGLLWFGQTTFLAVAAASGQEVPVTGPSAPGARTMPLPDGGSVEWSYRPDGYPDRTRVLDTDGSVRFEFEGEPWVAPVTDGSFPDVLAMRKAVTQDVVGLDVRTGDLRWSARTMQGMYPYVHIDGVVIAVGTLRAVAVDVRDGARLWEEPIARPRTAPLTDGRVVLILTREQGTIGIAAHRLRTGNVAWRVPVPDDAFYLEQAGQDLVLVHTPRGVIAFR
jgi:outer membrane protein assembly factor BamB